MPVLVNPKLCLDRDHCYAATGCPYGAYSHNVEARTWEVDATVCGTCPGPCLNFCDAYAVRWGDTLFEIDLLKQQLAGAITAEEMAAQLAAEKEREAQARAEEEAAKKQEAAIVAITRANFQAEVVEAALPVLMDCWADWCGPCKQFAPTFEAFAARYAGVVKCVKLDTDREKVIAQQLGITALPTLVLFYRGQLIDGAQGALSPQQLETWVSSRLTALRQMYGPPDTPAAGVPGAATTPAAPAPAAAGDAAAPAPPAGKGQPKTKDGKPLKLYLP